MTEMVICPWYLGYVLLLGGFVSGMIFMSGICLILRSRNRPQDPDDTNDFYERDREDWDRSETV